MHEPWVEKYRPSTLSEVRGQREIVEQFQRTLERNQAMHFLFYGSPGTGKTSMILSFCRDIYDAAQWRSHVLEINASYDRGIDMVRDKIKAFCKKSITPFERNGRRIHYKFVILDEADTLTNDAQNSLRRCIEIYSYNTRFCFLCNYPSKIIAPILSRCSVCHFQPIARVDALAQMRWICNQEALPCEDDVLERIYKHSRGDLRTCVSSLQALHFLYGDVSTDSFDDYVRACPTHIWTTLASAPLAEIPRIADMLHARAHSARAIAASLIEWLLSRACTDGVDDDDDEHERLYQLSMELSTLERHTQLCHDARLFLHAVLHHAWLYLHATTT